MYFCVYLTRFLAILLNSLNLLLKQLEEDKIEYICWHDTRYPRLLLEIHDPPPILFYQGNISILNQPNNFLAVIGSRKNTPYAEKIINSFILDLVKYNFVIISGLAFGIDSLAHQATLTARGTTIAVLGSGLQQKYIYPRKHRLLAKNIINSGGLIISEFVPDCPAQKTNFPRRNRIISGLSQGVLIVEAEIKSGSLITADHALNQNRDILAIPGNIFLGSSVGTNALIKKGAQLITNVNDILTTFNIEESININTNHQLNLFSNLKYHPQTLIENEIYQLIYQAALKGDKINTNEIIKKTKLDTSTINSTLSILEIAGAIKNQDSCLEPNL